MGKDTGLTLETDKQSQSPFYRALHAGRYERQTQIRSYEETRGRRLIVLMGVITPEVVSPFADAIQDVDKSDPLDLMLVSPGGDGETAYRLASMCHMGRDDFRVVVPDRAMSAATLLALSAEEILMSDPSVLGPIDPQLWLPTRGGLVAAKDIIKIVEDSEAKAVEKPEAVIWFVNMLGDIDAVIYRQAVASMERTRELVPEVFGLRRDPPNVQEVGEIVNKLQDPAVHAAVISHAKAGEIGLPVIYVEPDSLEWIPIWRLYTQYQVLVGGDQMMSVIEGGRVSLIWRSGQG